MTRLLLDTHVFLWFLAGDERMPARARDVIGQDRSEVLVSAASVWEIAIKASLGRLAMEGSDVDRLPALIDEAGFEELPVLAVHAAAVHGLPGHHRDPFDRLLVAQARTERLTLVTTDPALRAYDVPIL